MDTSEGHTSSPGLSFLSFLMGIKYIFLEQFSLHCSDLLLLGTRALPCLPSLQSHKNPPPAGPLEAVSWLRGKENSDVTHTCWTLTWIQSGKTLLNFPKASLHPLFRSRGQSLPPHGLQEILTLASTGRTVAYFPGWALRRSMLRPGWPSPKGTNNTQSHPLMALAMEEHDIKSPFSLPSLSLQCVILLFPDVFFLIIVAWSIRRVSQCSLNTQWMWGNTKYLGLNTFSFLLNDSHSW